MPPFSPEKLVDTLDENLCTEPVYNVSIEKMVNRLDENLSTEAVYNGCVQCLPRKARTPIK